MIPDTTLPKQPDIMIWTGKISQAGTAAPTAKILLNTMAEQPGQGNVYFTRQANAIYRAYAAGFVMPEDLTALIWSPYLTEGENVIVLWQATNYVEINVPAGDDFLVDFLLEIRVYKNLKTL